MQNKFVNPWNGVEYDWPINHSDEQTFGRTRSIQHTAPTSGNGLVRQQGDDPPMVLHLQGTILHKDHYDQMVAWFDVSSRITIYFYDFTGDGYEVVITSFEPVRKRTVRNPKDFANAPYWYWTYDIQMEVVRFLTASAWSVTLP